MHVYGMSTTIRLSSAQKRKLQEAQAILQKQSTRKISQGKAVVALAEFALRNRVLLVRASEGMRRALKDDPFYDLSIVFDAGPTDARMHDPVLYGMRCGGACVPGHKLPCREIQPDGLETSRSPFLSGG